MIDPVTGEVLAELGVYVGITTNNVAEYNGMMAGVRRALEIDPKAVLHVRLDSKLVVEQMSGRWKIKNAALADLAAEARGILSGTPVSFEWIPRAENSRADRLANESMDKQASFERLLENRVARRTRYAGQRKRVGQTVASSLLRRGCRGTSGLHRAGRWVTPTRSNPRESATESRPPRRLRDRR